MKKDPDFFINGCGRSGTTLLSAILSSSSDVFVLNDSFIFETFYKYYRNSRKKGAFASLFLGEKIVKKKTIYKLLRTLKKHFFYNLSSRNFLPLLSDLPKGDFSVSDKEARYYIHFLNNRYVHSSVLEGTKHWLSEYSDKLDRELSLSKKSYTLKELFSQVFFALIPTVFRGRMVFGEKTPSHFYFSEWIKNIYPESKNIIMIRNPISNIASLFKRQKSLVYSINEYLSFFPERLFKDRRGSIIIRYEDIIYDRKRTISEIYKYLSISEKIPDEINTYDFTFYSKNYYVGEKIDPKRDINLMNLLNSRQRKRVLKTCERIFEEFYPDIKAIYPDLKK